jgi:hypothetical protein
MLKMQRAQKHFEELEDAVQTFLRSYPYTAVHEEDVEPHHYVARLKVIREPPPELSPIIGDIIHNGRSALDHLVWLLIKMVGRDPELGRPQFPIFTKDPFDPSAFANAKDHKRALKVWENQTRGLAPLHVGIIKRMQPYHRGKDAHSHPLARLNKLSNWDKHRELHFAGQAAIGTDARIEGVSPNVFIKILWFLPKMEAVKDGEIVARYESRRIGEGEAKGELKLRLVFDVAFGEGSPLEGLRVVDTLSEIGKHVSDVLLAFKLRFDRKL